MASTRLLLAPALALAVVLAAAPAASAAEYSPACSADGVVQSGQPKCSLKTTTVAVTTDKPYVYLSGYVRITGDNRPNGMNTQRTELRSILYCYDAAGAKVYGQAAERNVWPGVGDVTVNIRGVLYQSVAGQYRCDMVAFLNPVNKDMALTTFTLGASFDAPIYKKYGDGTFGPNTPGDPAWDPIEGPPVSPERVLVPSGATVSPVAQLDWTGVPTDVTAALGISMTNLTTCSFGTDKPPCPSPAAGTASVTVTQTMWQAADKDASPCPLVAPVTTDPLTVTMTDELHHGTYAMTGRLTGLTTDAACSRRVLVKTTVTNRGPLDVYVESKNTAISATN